MFIEKLDVRHFRNFEALELTFSEPLTVVIGKNGSGKSSLLESIFYLGFGRSFRTSNPKSLINHENDAFTIFVSGKSRRDDPSPMSQVKAGIQRSRSGELKLKVNGETINSLSELAALFPIQIFTPQSTDLVLGSPKLRRGFIDWGVFHVEHSFGSMSKRYASALKQRNALLKQANKGSNTVDDAIFISWDKQLSSLGDSIDSVRQDYLKRFMPIFKRVQQQLIPEIDIEIEYNRGWDSAAELSASIQARFAQDKRFGSTSVGPHKADIKFKSDSRDASEVLSRGQLRMAVAAALIAQTRLYNQESNLESVFLLDDLGAELDEAKRELLIDQIHDLKTQVIVTAIDESQIGFMKKYQNKKMFHVEHNHVLEEL